MSWRNRVGLTVTLPELEDHASWIVQQGRDVELQDPCEPAVMDGDWPAYARRSRELLSGHQGRIGIHGPFFSLTLAALDSQIRVVVQRRLLWGLDYAAEVGARYMVLHSPLVPAGHPMTDYQQGIHELEWARPTLAPVIARAEEQQVTLMIENITDINPRALLTFVQAFDSPAVKMSVDVGHAHLSVQRGGPPAHWWLQQAGDWLGHVHLQDNDGCADQHLAPGGGTLAWSPLLTTLDQHVAQPYVVLEVNPPELKAAQCWAEQIVTASPAGNL